MIFRYCAESKSTIQVTTNQELKNFHTSFFKSVLHDIIPRLMSESSRIFYMCRACQRKK